MADADDAKTEIERDVERGHAAGNRLVNRWTRLLLGWGVEARGILPVPDDQRSDTRLYQIFFLWFSWNFNILSFSAGTLAPAFGLGLRDAALVIVFFNLLCAAPPAYFSTWGPKLGLRQMCQARYSFGYYPVLVPTVLNIIGMLGFCILNCILGGQTLSAVSGGGLSWTVGIVVIAVISLFISFCGIRVVTWYERLAWLPVLVSVLVALGVGGKHLSLGAGPAPAPATPAAVLSFASVVAGFVITYAPLGSDYTTYLHRGAPGWKLFLYSYAGLVLPIASLQVLGAAAALAAAQHAPWGAAFADGDVGALLRAMLQGTCGGGAFLTALLALSVVGNVAPTMYSFGLNVQVFVPWAVRVPRYVFALLAAAIILPLAIVGAHRFYATLNDFLAVIGYWASAFAAVVLAEHVVFRRARFDRYDIAAWNTPGALPPGLAGLGAALLAVPLVVPSMAQAWYVGPIGARAGDIGFEVAFAVAGLAYVPLRALEKRVFER